MPEPDDVNAQPTIAPTNKTLAATGGSAMGAAIATIVLYVTGWYKLPQPVSAALTALISAAVAFIASYLTRHGSGEGILKDAASGRVLSVR